MAKSEAIDIPDSGATVDTDEGDEDNNANEVSEAGSEEVVSSSPNAKRFLAGNSNSLDDISSREVKRERERKNRRVRNKTMVVARKRSELGF